MKKYNKKSFLILTIIVTVVAVTSLQSFASLDEEVVTMDRSTVEVLTLESVSINREMEALLTASGVSEKTYKSFLVEYNVHEMYQEQLQLLGADGKSIQDIMIGYAFLEEKVGLLADLEGLIAMKNQFGWASAFKKYKDAQKPFIPMEFDSAYLDDLLSRASITADDIMLADLAAHQTLMKFEDVIAYRISGECWKDIFAELGIAKSSSQLPRVQVTNEDIAKYSRILGLTEDQILSGFVLAEKLDQSPNEILLKTKSGQTEEEIQAFYLEEKYTN